MSKTTCVHVDCAFWHYRNGRHRCAYEFCSCCAYAPATSEGK